MYPQDEQQPKRVRDLSSRWERLHELELPVPPAVSALCDEKQISPESLLALGTRFKLVGKGPDMLLAWSHTNGNGVVTGIKYRNLSTGKRTAETGSTYLLPKLIGNLTSTDWICVEGETDGARMLELTQGRACVVILPSATTILKEYVAVIPRGARVYAALDNDPSGELGAQKLVRMAGALRLSPAPYKDWCEWQGGPETFAALVTEAAQQKKQSAGFVKVADILEELAHEQQAPGVPVPFDLFDTSTSSGAQPGHLYVLGGYSGDGKTSLALQFLIEAVKAGRSVGFFSLEMNRRDLTRRLVSMIQGKTEETALRGWEAWVLDDLEDADLTPYLDEHEFDLVIVDHLHHLPYDDRFAIEKIVNNMKKWALRYDIPILLLSQLNSSPDQTDPFPRPHMNRLRETRKIGQLADLIFFVWRERDEENQVTNDAEILIVKDRFGDNPRTHLVRFEGAHTRFSPRYDVVPIQPWSEVTQADLDALDEPELGWYR